MQNIGQSYNNYISRVKPNGQFMGIIYEMLTKEVSEFIVLFIISLYSNNFGADINQIKKIANLDDLRLNKYIQQLQQKGLIYIKDNRYYFLTDQGKQVVINSYFTLLERI